LFVVVKLFVVLHQLGLTKLKLEYLKSNFKCKHRQKFFHYSSSTFLDFNSSLLLKNGRKFFFFSSPHASFKQVEFRKGSSVIG